MMEEDWKYLIILDACRFDYFSQLYSRFLTGRLEKRLSEGTCTPEFLQNTFTGRYPDTIYVSANPYVSSHANPHVDSHQRGRFDASSIFFRVVDGWNLCWDGKLETVPPWRLRRLAELQIAKHPDKRFIIHFIQPHAPYIQPVGSTGRPHPLRRVRRGPSRWQGSKVPRLALRSYRWLYFRLKLGIVGWEVGRLLGFPPFDVMDQARRDLGVAGLRAAYARNLALALEQSSKLVNRLTGKIVITSDHGECLGENGRYGHLCKSKSSLLRTVPWFSCERPD